MPGDETFSKQESLTGSGSSEFLSHAIFDALANELAARSGRRNVQGWIHEALGRDVDIESKINSAADLISLMRPFVPPQTEVMDFGCGRGPHREVFERAGYQWLGVDYFDSKSIHFARDLPTDVVGYDGVRLPFDDARFAGGWSWQALEHVRQPDQAIAEIARVIRVGGCFAGSTSFLEPFHGYSTYCYTPFGFKILLGRHGFKLKGIYPGTDGLSLILKYLESILGIDETPGLLNQCRLASILSEALGDKVQRRKLAEIQLQLCGHFRFVAERVASR